MTQTIETEINALPHPVTADPLNPAVGDLMSKAILESGEAYIESILHELERNAMAASKLLEQGKVWAQSERQRFRDRAADIAAAHKEMQDSREKFLALPRVETNGNGPAI